MSARALAQLTVVVLAVVALALAAVLVARGAGGAGPWAAPPADAPACDLSGAPAPLSPRSHDTLLLAFAERGVTLTLDGSPLVSLPQDPTRFPAGAHTLGVECDGQRREQPLDLRPFGPAAVWASCSELYVFGALCDGCPTEAQGRKAAARAGLDSALHAASTAQQRLDAAERAEATAHLTSRWNALTERYARVLGVVGREAPGPVAKANLRFEELSHGISAATTAADPAAQDQLIRAAEETLAAFVKAARHARPRDCAFQKRLTDSL